MTERDVPAWEDVPDLPEDGGAWSHVAPVADTEASRARIAREFDARVALDDLRALLDTPLPTRPVRERLLERAIRALTHVAGA